MRQRVPSRHVPVDRSLGVQGVGDPPEQHGNLNHRADDGRKGDAEHHDGDGQLEVVARRREPDRGRRVISPDTASRSSRGTSRSR